MAVCRPASPAGLLARAVSLCHVPLPSPPPPPHSAAPAPPPPADGGAVRLSAAAEWAVTHANRFLSAVSPERARLFFDAVALFVFCYFVARTCLYVTRRRKGLVGPAVAPILLRFWAVYGALEVVTHVLSLYAAPLGAACVLSLARASVLVALTRGRRLSVAARLYDAHVAPFYETHEAEVERRLAAARADWEEIDDALRKLATHLLKKVAVGGLAALFAEDVAEGEEGGEGEAGGRQGGPVGGRRRREVARALPQGERAVFPSGKRFFAGEAEDRANAARNASSMDDIDAIHVEAPEAPKSRYDDLRSLRRKYSRRGLRDTQRGVGG